MTAEQFDKAKSIVGRIERIKATLEKYDSAEIQINKKDSYESWNLEGVNISKQQLLEISKYNKEYLRNEKDFLEKQLLNI